MLKSDPLFPFGKGHCFLDLVSKELTTHVSFCLCSHPNMSLTLCFLGLEGLAIDPFHLLILLFCFILFSSSPDLLSLLCQLR